MKEKIANVSWLLFYLLFMIAMAAMCSHIGE